MKVKELVEELKLAPQDAPVCVQSFIDEDEEVDVLWKMENGEIVAVVLQ